jgi:Zn-dependent protease/predicted transcriptional regulator
MKTSFNIGKIIGIPINLHITFLLILPLFAWVFSIASLDFFGLEVGFGNLKDSVLVRFIFGAIAAILFFGSVLAHELAHSYVAQRYGIKIKSITLYIFGGISQIEEIPRIPKYEFNISVVGPLCSFAIGLFSLGCVALVSFARSITDGGLLLDFLYITFSTLSFYNILVGGFNTIPAFPMDGGRILRSYLARSMPYVVATQRAASIGRMIAIIMGIFGFFFNFWLILIAFFIYLGATEEERMTTLTVTLEGVKVNEIMTSANHLDTVEPEMKVSDFVKFMLSRRHMAYPVVKEKKLVGVVTFNDILKIAQSNYENTTVGEIMSQKFVTISKDSDALDALKLLSSEDTNRVFVMDGEELVGLVTRNDISTAVTILGQTRPVKVPASFTNSDTMDKSKKGGLPAPG